MAVEQPGIRLVWSIDGVIESVEFDDLEDERLLRLELERRRVVAGC